MNINVLKHEAIKRFPILGKFLRVDYGFIPEEPKATDYVFGGDSFIKKKLVEDGNWLPYVPMGERQSGRSVETMACTVFGFYNVLETLANRLYGEKWDKSDRFTAKMAGITSAGGLMTNVLESVRKEDGAVDQAVWPNNIEDFNWSQFYANPPLDVKDKAKQFLNDYEIKYEIVGSSPNAIREALKYSPVYCAGYAWYRSGDKYFSAGSPNHCFMIVGMRDNGDYIAYDSYEPFVKTLDKSFNVAYGKLVVLRKKTLTEFNESLLAALVKKGVRFIMRVMAAGEIYEIRDNKLVYISPEEWNNINVRELGQRRELMGVPEEYFYKLIT